MRWFPQPGLPALVSWLTDLQHQIHGRSPDTFAVTVTTGSQDALSMVRASVLL